MGMLEIQDLRSGYGEIEVLWSVSLSTLDKGITSLLGPNGAGKTTLLNCITGLQNSWAGSVNFLGADITNKKPHQVVDIGISMVPEGRRIFTAMTVLENLLMGAYTKRARKRIKDSLERVYHVFPILKERKNQVAGTLSGGERQMLAIGRSLMSRPKLLLMDEVSTGLAPKLVLRVMETISQLSNEGLPILLVEQHVEKALKVSQFAYVMEHGKIAMKGKSKELLVDKRLKKAYLGI
ncbi:MAG: ABC transporter ATP-binding protein [Candidatus Bathyarchaeota archaeon]|nr:ABC transporter ATP-binding protein [Candidatus Bathyarchaeota archaeon]